MARGDRGAGASRREKGRGKCRRINRACGGLRRPPARRHDRARGDLARKDGARGWRRCRARPAHRGGNRMKDPDEVLTALEDIIADLGEAAAKGAVVVEGRRDAHALAELHIEGAIEVLNRGAPLLALCDALAAEHGRITVLTDWDAK